jgi:hypothetical protein
MPFRRDLSLSMPNPLRNVPNKIAESQIEREVPVAWRGDWSLTQYVNNYSLKASGIGFVSSPYTSLWDRVWGVTPVEDLPKYKALYSFVPRIQASVDVKVNLEISNGFVLEGGTATFRDFLEEWIESHDLLATMRSEETDALVFGTSYTEPVMDEDSACVEWLKTLDPVFMRIRQDCFKNIFGYAQLNSYPPVVFWPEEIYRTLNNVKSWQFENAYGTSSLRSILHVQALLDDFQVDMAKIMKIYTKPMMVAQCGGDGAPGNPEPWSDPQLDNMSNTLAARDQGTDLTVRGDVKITPMSSMTKDLKAEWWIQYLERQRDSQLGVPKIFLGESEGANRATADVVMQEFITRLRMRQKHRSGVYETQLFPLILRGDFPESLIVPDKIPKLKWKPIWEPPTDVKMSRVIDLYNNMLMGDEEARAELGLPEEIKGNLKQQPVAAPMPESMGQGGAEDREFETPGEPQQKAMGKGLPLKLVKDGHGASYLVRALS